MNLFKVPRDLASATNDGMNLRCPLPKYSLFSSAPCFDLLWPQNLQAIKVKKRYISEIQHFYIALCKHVKLG